MDSVNDEGVNCPCGEDHANDLAVAQAQIFLSEMADQFKIFIPSLATSLQADDKGNVYLSGEALVDVSQRAATMVAMNTLNGVPAETTSAILITLFSAVAAYTQDGPEAMEYFLEGVKNL